MASDAALTVCADSAALAENAANLIIDVATEAVRERGRFMLCLAGGETPRATYARLALPAFSERLRWDRTWAFFGDERVVPPDHPESNYRMAHETLLSREERARAEDRDRYFRVRADDRDLNYRKYFVEGERRISELDDYTSENTQRLAVPEIKQLLMKHDLISGTVDA